MDWESTLEGALKRRKILPVTAVNVRRWRAVSSLPMWAADTIDWLLQQAQWSELDSRFYRSLELGTAGMRGRIIGEVASPMELAENGQPLHAAVGSANMNDFAVARATIALFRHWLQYAMGPLRLAIAYDVRHFSQHFAKITAAVWQALGGDAFLFSGPRSTPQLSFAVRQLQTTTGVVITASHNPYWDNGYKIYNSTGAQVIAPDSTAIMHHYETITVEEVCRTLAALPEEPQIAIMGEEMDALYTCRLMDSVIDPTALHYFGKPAIFTPLHGTGQIIGEALLGSLGIPFVTVACQRYPDPNFSTVRSPNPENRDALGLALALADELGAELALATDPDGDRLAISLRGSDGKMHTLSGNEMAVFILAYRMEALKKTGILCDTTEAHAVVIRSLVTTPLLDRIAADHGVRTVTTPIGFKWIGERLQVYEEQLLKHLPDDCPYRDLKEEDRRRAALRWGNYLILGAEESCGCMALDVTRDKDAHSAMAMVCEAVASLRRNGQTWEDFFATIYRRHGYHGEHLHTAILSGPSGEERMRTFLHSLETDPPIAFDTFSVIHWTNFTSDSIVDADGQRIPNCPLHIFDLSGGYRLAIRASGTEPKIKFYLFAREDGVDCVRARECVNANFTILVNAIENMLALRTGE
jgi:phosphoglucomutase